MALALPFIIRLAPHTTTSLIPNTTTTTTTQFVKSKALEHGADPAIMAQIPPPF